MKNAVLNMEFADPNMREFEKFQQKDAKRMYDEDMMIIDNLR